MARRCCRPRLLLLAMFGGVALYGWYGALLFLLDSGDATSTMTQQPGTAGGGAIWGRKYIDNISAMAAAMETHRLSDAEALTVQGTPEVPQQRLSVEDRDWQACGAQLLNGPARRQYTAAAALTAAAAPEVELVFSLVTSSPPHTVRRAVENLLAFTTERSWVVVHLGKFPAVPYDKRDLDYRWLLAQDRVRINDVRLGITARHGSELWAHMHNYRVVRERQQLQSSRSPLQRFFVFGSELQTVLRPGLERWISERQASIPEAGVPIVLPGQAALFEDVTQWHNIRPASWEPQGSFYPLSVIGRFYDFLLADSQIYTTLFHEREDSAQYWLPSYIMIREEKWLATLKRRPNDADGGTGPIVRSGPHTDICRAPVCHQIRAIVFANTRSSVTSGTSTTIQQDDRGDEGIYGVSFGSSALSPACNNNEGGEKFDMYGYEELTRALGSEARQEIDQSNRQDRQQLQSPPQPYLPGTTSRHSGGTHGMSHSNAAGGGDETR